MQATSTTQSSQPENHEQQTGQSSPGDFKRLMVLLRSVRSVWTIAVYHDAETRKRIIEQLRRALAPISVVEFSLVGNQHPDPLVLIQEMDLGAGNPAYDESTAPVVNFTDLTNVLKEVSQYLDVQRELLARLPHRLVFWVTEHDKRALAEHAPNFYSRISGVFTFPGTLAPPNEISIPNVQQTKDSPLSRTLRTHAKLPNIRSEKDRRRWTEYYEDRIEELSSRPQPDIHAIAESWYVLASLYATYSPPRWEDAEQAFLHAARYFNNINDTTAYADALALAGEVARSSYKADTALLHLSQALTLYRLLDKRVDEAAVLGTIGLIKELAADHAGALENYSEALKLYRELNDTAGAATAMKNVGDVQRFRDQYDEALENYQQALTLYRAVGDRLGEAYVLKAIGDVQQFRGQNLEAFENYQQALTLHRAVGSKLGEANVLKAIGDVQQFHRDLDEALESYQQALTLHRAVGSKLGEANVLQAIGDVQQFHKNLDEALENYQQALTLYRAVGDRLGEANALKAIGDVQQFRDQYDEALENYQQALTLYRAVGDRLGEANALKAIGDVQQFRDQYDEALESYQQALTLYRAVASKLGEANALKAIGDVQQFRDQYDEALESYQQALTLHRAVEDRLGEANALSAMSRVSLLMSQVQTADALLGKAILLYNAIGDRYSVAVSLKNQGVALGFLGRPRLAIPYLQQAAAIFADLKLDDIIVRTSTSLAKQQYLDRLLNTIAAITLGTQEHHAECEQMLRELEEAGYHLTSPIHRIWDGERDPETLTQNLDRTDAGLIQSTLELIEETSAEHVQEETRGAT